MNKTLLDRDVAFTKMHGLGNDFVIIDGRGHTFTISPLEAMFLAHRRYGIGCDQVVILHEDPLVAARLTIFNPDGSVSSVCGNAFRCIGSMLWHEMPMPLNPMPLNHGDQSNESNNRHDRAHTGIPSDTVIAIRAGERIIRTWLDQSLEDGIDVWSCDMGHALFNHQDIGIAEESLDLLNMPITHKAFTYDGQPFALQRCGSVWTGNPHVTFTTDQDITTLNLEAFGAEVGASDIFSKGVNVGVIQIIDRGHAILRVFERGAGSTLACGSGACAAVAIARRWELVDPQVALTMPGGTMTVTVDANSGAITQSGPACVVFHGFAHIPNASILSDIFSHTPPSTV